jgi:VWFA-related protein
VKCLSCLIILSLSVHAQGPGIQVPQDPQDVVRVTTALVQVDVVVTKDGKQVTDLKADDFEILEDGRRQQITNFAYVSINSSASPASSTNSSASPAGGSNPNPPPVLPIKPPTPHEVRRTVAIVVDDLGMSFQSMANLRNYLRKFMSESLGPNDLVAIIRTGGEVGALQQFTTDQRLLASAIADLKWNACSRVGASVLSPERSLVTLMPPESQLRGRLPPDRSPGSNQVTRPTIANESNACAVGSSVNYSINAIRFILRGMRDLPGRKSMMIVSDNLPMERQEGAPADFGFKRPVRENANIIDVWTQTTSYRDGLHGLAEQAIRSSVVIYGVSSQQLQTVGANPADEISYPPPRMMRNARPEQQNPLQNLMNVRSAELRKNVDGAELLAKETGGFVIRNRNDFGVERVLEDQNGYYLIGYKPATETFNRRFHKIHARVKRSGLTVRTRAGFYGVTEEPAAGPTAETDRLNKALTSPFGANDITVRLTSLFANDTERGSMLRTFVNLEAKDLTFTQEADGSHVAKFDLSSVVFSDNGGVVNRQDQTATLRLRGQPYERALREGVVYGVDLPLKRAGAFQVRVAVRDSASQRIGAAGQFVQAPNIGDGTLSLSGILLYPETQNGEDEMRRALVLRRFHQGASLVFGYTIYNAGFDKKTRDHRLTTQTVVFRDSIKIYSSDRVAVAATDNRDPTRINTGARLQLGPALTPGEYVVQIVVEDAVAKRTATQVTQFEVIK